MNINHVVSTTVLVGAIGLSVFGCGRSEDMMGPTPTTSIRIVPEEGSENVSTT